MHEQDHAHLERFCNGEIPTDTQKAYALFEQCWMTFTNGPIPAPLLGLIAVFSGGVKKKVRPESRFDTTNPGTQVCVKHDFEDRVAHEGTFVAVGEGINTGQICVEVFGDKMFFPEKRVFFKSEIAPRPLKVIAEQFSEDENGDLVEEEVDDNPDNIITDMEDTEWSKVEEGRRVWCDMDGELKPGKFIMVDPNNGRVLRVKLDGVDVEKNSYTRVHWSDVKPQREIVTS